MKNTLFCISLRFRTNGAGSIFDVLSDAANVRECIRGGPYPFLYLLGWGRGNLTFLLGPNYVQRIRDRGNSSVFLRVR